MHQFAGMWLNPNSRGSRLRIWQPWGCIAFRVSERQLWAPDLQGLGSPFPSCPPAFATCGLPPVAKAASPKLIERVGFVDGYGQASQPDDAQGFSAKAGSFISHGDWLQRE